MNLLKRFTRKRVELNTTRELVSEGDFPIIRDEVISLIEYIGKQMETETWFKELSENAKFGVLLSNTKMVARLIDIQRRNDGMKEED